MAHSGSRFALLAALLCPGGQAQQVGKVSAEEHLPMPIEVCTRAKGCEKEATKLTLDAERRWLHDASTGNCGGLGNWNKTTCPDEVTCARTCGLDGVSRKQYTDTYGVAEIDGGVRINYMTGETNVGSRVYLMDSSKDEYRVLRLKNREVAFEVDVSLLECGMNAATYLVEMPANGGKGVGENAAGAKYGTGYCDARCPSELKFIDGKANMYGTYGSCCAEIDLFEANKMAGAFTAHPCRNPGLYRCEGIECGDGDKHQYYQGACDKDGCEFNPYRMGNKTLLGPGSTVDTNRPVTVVTQFLTEDGTDGGALSEIRIFYKQDGRVIPNTHSTIGGIQGDSITNELCDAEKAAFVQTRDIGNVEGDYNQFREKGGLQALGDALDRGMVLVLALWDDEVIKMQWLDSFLPHDLPTGTPGALRGGCDMTWGEADWMRKNIPERYATFAKFQIGEIGSTAKDTQQKVKTEDKQEARQQEIDEEEEEDDDEDEGLVKRAPAVVRLAAQTEVFAPLPSQHAGQVTPVAARPSLWSFPGILLVFSAVALVPVTAKTVRHLRRKDRQQPLLVPTGCAE